MAAYLLCLTAEGGVPLFYRTRNDLKSLPFPVLGSLNGVHMFCSSHNVDLKSTSTADSKIIWKDYHNSVSLVVVSSDDGASDVHLTTLLDHIFHAMVLVYGLEDTTNIKNIERFKREIKVCYKLIDGLLEHLPSPVFGDVSLTVDVIVSQETGVLQSYIDAFAEAADSPYGCLLVAGKVAVATAKWWELSASELLLLTMLVSSLPVATSRDVAVFLPHSSPTVPHRLLTFQLMLMVEVCVICGPTPSLTEVESEVDRFWKPSLESLRSLLRLHPRNFPSHLTLDSNILGFMLLNATSHRCLCSVYPHPEDSSRRHTGKPLSSVERRQILRAYYKTLTGHVWSSAGHSTTPHDNYHDISENLSHPVTDTYVCTERHKCYALVQAPYRLVILYSPGIPTYAMRSVSQKTLHLLLKDKSVLNSV